MWEDENPNSLKPPKPTLPETNILLMAEIRRSPVEVGSLSHYLQRVLYIPGGAGILPSTVVPENGWLEDYFPFGMAFFRGELLLSGRVSVRT